MWRGSVFISAFIAAVAVVALVLLVTLTTSRPSSTTRAVPSETLSKNEEFLINQINPDNIRNNLRFLTSRPRLAGTEADWQVSKWVEDLWKSQGLDTVRHVPYDVLLSYPSDTLPNLVRVLDQAGSAVWTSAPKQAPLYAPEEDSPEVPFNFNGYAASGNVKGPVVYACYGRTEDFDKLKELGVEVKGAIVLARYGIIFRANKAAIAEERGALGMVLFSDPEDYADGPDKGKTYPSSVLMPETAVAAGTVKLVDGDPLTPFYPAIESAFRVPEEEATIPKIPVQAISYGEAWHILSRMAGEAAPTAWQGGLNVTYRLGPGLRQAGHTLNLEVNNHNELTTINNTVGVITGSLEPDRYVLFGNHIDAWVFGAVDPFAGTAVMMEISRVFMQLANETGWRPRRSLVFCAWGAEEYGLVGSMEWTEQFNKQLGNRAVAYLNVDMAIEGNYTLRTKSAPLLYDIIYDAAKKVANPDPEEVLAGHLTVYDTWAARKPNPALPGTPVMQFIGSGSDYKGFQHNIGVPSMDVRYTHDNTTLGEPLYHTLYETFELVNELYDRGFNFHAAVAAVCADVAFGLADTKILPFSLGAYVDFITGAQKELIQNYGDLLDSHNISMKYFTDSALAFNMSVVDFQAAVNGLDLDKDLAVRAANDQLMMVERAFIDPRGLPGRPEYNHVVFAPGANNAYSGTAFSGLTDTLDALRQAPADQQDALWRTFQEHLAVVTHLLNTAAKVLTDDLW